MPVKEKSLIGGSIFLLLLAVLTAYSHTVSNLLILWSNDANPTYSHGLLLAVVSALIIIREWRVQPQLVISPSPLPVMLLVIFCSIWFLAALAAIQIVQMLMLIAIVSSPFWAVLGFQSARPFFFPFLLMLAALPIWEVFGPFLQTATALGAGAMTMLTIVPSFREGMHILIPAGTFEVEAGCSGLNYFVVAVVISALFCYLNEIKWPKAVVYVLAAMIMSLFANIIRVYIIVISGQMTNMQSYFVTVDHVALGWVIFFLGITLYLWLVNRSLSKVKVVGHVTRTAEVGRSSELPSAGRLNTVSVASYLGLLFFVVIAGPLLHGYYQLKYVQPPVLEKIMPMKIDGWEKVVPRDSYKPYFGEGMLTAESLYTGGEGDSSVYVYMNYYYYQTQGREAVNDLHYIADGRRWYSQTEGLVNADVAGFEDVLEVSVVSENGQEKLIWQWYETDYSRTGAKLWAQVYSLMGVIVGKPSVNVLLIATDVKEDKKAARGVLKRFLSDSNGKIGVVAI